MTTTVAPRAPYDTPTARAGRPRPAGAVRASLTLGWRALLKIRRAPEQMADSIMIPVLFTLLFTYLFGGALSGTPGEYLQFLLPGTLVMSVLLITMYGGFVLNTDRARGTLDRYRSLPVWQPALIVGGLIGDAGRYVLASGLVIGLGLAMGFRPDGGATGVLLGVGLILAFAFGLSWIWTTLGLLVRSSQSLMMLSFLVQFPLVFASNIFVDPATLPSWLRAFVDVNPVSLLVTAERGLMQGTASFGDVAWVLLAAAALVAVFAPLTMRLYRTRT